MIIMVVSIYSKMKQRVIDGLLGLVIGVILFMFLSPKNTSAEEALKQRDIQRTEQIKILTKTIRDLETKDKLLLNTITLLRKDRYKAQRETKLYRDRYEHLKSIPMRHYSDSQLDSILFALYGPDR